MQTHSATINLGLMRRSEGLARAEEGSGEESARASAFCFGEILAGLLLKIGILDKPIFNLFEKTFQIFKTLFYPLGCTQSDEVQGKIRFCKEM